VLTARAASIFAYPSLKFTSFETLMHSCKDSREPTCICYRYIAKSSLPVQPSKLTGDLPQWSDGLFTALRWSHTQDSLGVNSFDRSAPSDSIRDMSKFEFWENPLHGRNQ
jgi:hypothetical protein